jgi:hypothetical protein
MQDGAPRGMAVRPFSVSGLIVVVVDADAIAGVEVVCVFFVGILGAPIFDVPVRAEDVVERNNALLYADVEGRFGRGWERTGACPNRRMVNKDKRAAIARVGRGLIIESFTVRSG